MRYPSCTKSNHTIRAAAPTPNTQNTRAEDRITWQLGLQDSAREAEIWRARGPGSEHKNFEQESGSVQANRKWRPAIWRAGTLGKKQNW
jgi:hypothetical protein